MKSQTMTRPTRERILDELRRLVAARPGEPVGRARFMRETGIKRSAWEGRYWASWSDVLKEAGIPTNILNPPLDEEGLLRQLADLTRELGRMPTAQHLRLTSRARPGFPTDKTYVKRFGSATGVRKALRDWIGEHAEYTDLAELVPAGNTKSPAQSQPKETQQSADSNSFVPPVVASIPTLASMESAQPVELEERVAVAFEILGLEVQRLGQGSGRHPDGIAKCRENGWAVIYDVKARAGVYRILAPEERKFREYIERHAQDLRRDGMGKLYFALISNGYSENDVARARELSRTTEAKAVVLLEASALVKAVEQHIASPRSFTYQHLERAFSETRIVRLTDIGDSQPLQPVSDEATVVPVVRADIGNDDGASGTFATLMSRWPDFEAKVKTLAEFFDYTMTYCLANALQSTDGLDTSKADDAALNGRREAALSALGLLNHLTWQLVEDLKPRPTTLEHARSIVVRFRTLLSAPAILAVDGLYQALGSRSSRPQEFTDRMARFKAFKLDYESFARSTNQHLGVEFFRPYTS